MRLIVNHAFAAMPDSCRQASVRSMCKYKRACFGSVLLRPVRSDLLTISRPHNERAERDKRCGVNRRYRDDDGFQLRESSNLGYLMRYREPSEKRIPKPPFARGRLFRGRHRSGNLVRRGLLGAADLGLSPAIQRFAGVKNDPSGLVKLRRVTCDHAFCQRFLAAEAVTLLQVYGSRGATKELRIFHCAVLLGNAPKGREQHGNLRTFPRDARDIKPPLSVLPSDAAALPRW